MSSGRPAVLVNAPGLAPPSPDGRPDGDFLDQCRTSLAERGWGPLQRLFDDPDIEEIWWNDPARVFCARAGRPELSTVVLTESEVHDMVMNAVLVSGRRLDSIRPFVDATLSDGSRLHVVIPSITERHWAVNIRRFPVSARTLVDLVVMESLSTPAAEFLEAAVRAGCNIVVSGGTQSGKTTTLNAVLGSLTGADRIVSCEEVRELRLDHPDWVALQTRDAGLEGHGEVDLRDLVRESLRMRPSRVVVGEVRGAEALDLLLAMNCGIPAAATIHANSAEDAVAKLCGLPLLAGPNIAADFIRSTVASCVDVVVHVDLRPGGRREVRQIVVVSAADGGPLFGQMFTRTHDELRRGGAEMPVRMRGLGR